MSRHKDGSRIVVCENVVEEAEEFVETIKSRYRYVLFTEEKFLIEHAKEAIAQAYISENDTKYLLIAAQEYTIYAQNALLKILEEPPRNIVFILFAPTKSALLATIRSRLPIEMRSFTKRHPSLTIDIRRLDTQAVFTFLQEHKNATKTEAKEILEALYLHAISQGVALSEDAIENFEIAYKLLELNARVLNVFSLVLMGLLHENKSTR